MSISFNKPVFEDRHYVLRIAITLLGGVIVAGFLTWFMSVLIEFGEQSVDESARVHILDFVRIKRDESSEKKRERAERPKTSEAPPAPSTPELSDAQGDVNSLGVSDLPVTLDVGLNLGGVNSGISEGEFLPIVKVAPVYPASAASRGIEGECLVEYSVTETGATKNIHVVDDQCSYVGFRRPSIAAAARFKYKPRIINGEAVEVARVRNLFLFTLEKKNGD